MSTLDSNRTLEIATASTPLRVLVAGVAVLRGVYTERSECARNDKARGNLAHSERPPERLLTTFVYTA